MATQTGYGYKKPGYGYVGPTQKKQPQMNTPYYQMASMLGRDRRANPLQTSRTLAGLTSSNATANPATSGPAAPPAAPKQLANVRDEQPMVQRQAQPPAQDAPAVGDYSHDPVLQKILSGSVRGREEATSAALAARKQLAIRSGNPALIPDDTLTAEAARANPFSSRATLKTGFEQGTRQLNENLNQRNLFYSGERIRANEDATSQYQRALAEQAQLEQDYASEIDAALAGELRYADEADYAAEGDAYTRALALALASGSTGAATTPEAEPPVENADGRNDDPLVAILGEAARRRAIERALSGYEGPVGGPMQALGF